jgi:hypothetical protein
VYEIRQPHPAYGRSSVIVKAPSSSSMALSRPAPVSHFGALPDPKSLIAVISADLGLFHIYLTPRSSSPSYLTRPRGCLTMLTQLMLPLLAIPAMAWWDGTSYTFYCMWAHGSSQRPAILR